VGPVFPSELLGAEGSPSSLPLGSGETLEGELEQPERRSELEPGIGVDEPSRSGVGPVRSRPGPELELHIERYADGTIREKGTTLDGRRHGDWEEFWPDGELKSSGRYQDELRTGTWRTYHDTGSTRSEGSYASDLREGHWISWHPNGERRQEVDYRAGRREGFSRLWHSNGQVKEAGSYQSGQRQGFWQFYFYDGTLDRRTGLYVDGARER